jgi:hypothetical protein
LLGRFFASTRVKPRDIGERFVVLHLVNLTGCPIQWHYPELWIAPDRRSPIALPQHGRAAAAQACLIAT